MTKAAPAKVTKAAPAKPSAKAAPAKAAKAAPRRPAPASAKPTTKAGSAQPAKTATTSAQARRTEQAALGGALRPRHRTTEDRPGKAGPGPLTDWVLRVHAMIDALWAEPAVDILAAWTAPPATEKQLAAVEAKLGLKLGDALRNLYLQADGLQVVWAPRGEVRGRTASSGRLAMPELERIPPDAGVIALMPVGEVFGLKGAPFMDYARFMPGAPPHWGFDFPGNYYTPAYVRSGAGLLVKVGDDHGAAWDGPAVTLERYLENVLATWGSVEARRELFVRGKGKAVQPAPLQKFLPKAGRR